MLVSGFAPKLRQRTAIPHGYRSQCLVLGLLPEQLKCTARGAGELSRYSRCRKQSFTHRILIELTWARSALATAPQIFLCLWLAVLDLRHKTDGSSQILAAPGARRKTACKLMIRSPPSPPEQFSSPWTLNGPSTEFMTKFSPSSRYHRTTSYTEPSRNGPCSTSYTEPSQSWPCSGRWMPPMRRQRCRGSGGGGTELDSWETEGLKA